jgi:hypothetical protein
MKESDIVYENGPASVFKINGRYEVVLRKGWRSELDSAYALDADGLSIAKARVDYLSQHTSA